MSTDYITIKEAKSLKKGSFIGVVIKQGDLKSGTKDDRDWTKKTYTIQDATDEVILTAWGEEISMLKVGNKYEFTNPWWKEYEGKITLALGKYATLKLVGTDEINNVNSSETPAETRGEVNAEPLPKFSQTEYVKQQTIWLLQIEATVRETMQQFMPTVEEPNNQKIGMFVKEIYNEMKRMSRDRA